MNNITPKKSYDILGTPTFPYDGPFDDGGGTTPPVSGSGTITLSTSTTSVKVGNEFNVDVRVDTGETKIKEYTFKVTFDPAVLEVVDSVSSENGVQMNYTDTYFTDQQNTAENAEGTIILSATTSSPITRNLKIGSITFRAKTTGSSLIKVDKANSLVYNESSADILQTTNSLTVTITGQTTPSSSTTTTIPHNTTTTTGHMPSGGVGNLGTIITLASGGFVLVLIGLRNFIVKLFKSKE